MKILILTLIISSCSLFNKHTNWKEFDEETNFYFSKIREITLSRALIEQSFFKESRLFLRFVSDETHEFKTKYPHIPSDLIHEFSMKAQQAALDQDTSTLGLIKSREQFITDMNRASLKFIEGLREWAKKRAIERSFF